MPRDDLMPFAGAAAAVLALGAFIYAVVAEENRKSDLIASGACKVDHSEWYTPPPSMVCMTYGQNGACTYWAPIQDDPYLRDHWSCPGEGFWRKAANQ